MFKTIRAVKFLFTGPLVLGVLFIINLTTGGPWWVQWPALGIGIAWVISLIRVVWALIVMGGLAALIAYLSGRTRAGAPGAIDIKPQP